MRKRVLRSIICFLLSAIMITECNLGAVNVYAAEITEGTDSESLDNQPDVDSSDETEENMDTLNGEDEEEIITASSYLYPFEEAVTALEELASTRTLHAVVYLADIITVRKLPEEASEPMKNLNSGDMVSIIGAGQDAEYNIWYQISYIDGEEEATGYVRKDNVACVDQEFIKWQENYVRSIGMFGRMSRVVSYSDVEQFPESYQDALYALKQKHPNWIFAKVTGNKGGVDWTTFVKKQIGSKSYIWTSGTPSSWKNGPTGEPNWSYASEGIIKYYMDPRNWLSEQGIFQFELLGYNPEYHTVEAVESILSGSFMANTQIENNMTYAQAFVEMGRTTDVSPFFLAARVLQEQGYQGNSPLISGKYPGYEGYYNYYNIGASGNNEKEVIENGLQKAKDKEWNSRYEALKAGVEFLLLDYIRVGQNTLYLQKFNMIGTLATHQYMQNIKAPSQEASIVHKAYNNKGLLNQGFIFRIPVYNNMPGKAAPKPGEEDKITLNSTNIDNLQVDSEITLHPLVNGKEAEGLNWNFTSSNPEVATVDSNGVVKAVKAGETTITCKCVDDPDNPNVGTCKVTVIPVLATIEMPILQSITYDPNITLKDVALPEGYTWVNPDIVPTAAKSSYGVIYNPDEEKYKPVTFDVNLQVNKKVLTSAEYTIPADLEGGAGRELSSVSLPIGFYWNDPAEKLADTIGTKEYLASYNPDNTNYETVTDVKIPVKIVCEKHNFGEWEITEATCENDGTKIRKCTICGSKEELTLEKTGHLYESEITLEATEEAEGIRTYTCKKCGDSYTESIPKLPSTHVHKYEESIVKKASCTEEGEKAFECSCGDKYTEVIEATGHKVENGRCQQCGYTDVVETPEEDKNTGSETTPDSSKPSEEGNTGSETTPDSSKPSEGGNTGSETTPDSSKPSEGENTNNGTTETSKPGEGGSTGNEVAPDSSKPGDTGNSSKPSDEETSNSSTPSNGSTTNNNSTPSNGSTTNSTTTNSSTVNNNTANNNATVNNSTVDNTLNSNTTTTNTNNGNTTNSNVTDQTTVVDNKSEETDTQKTEDSTVVQNQTKTENNVNRVEVELMSNLVESTKEEETVEGEKQTVAIQLNKNTEISQKIVEMAKEHGVNLEVSLPNNLKWTINSESLNDGMASAINMNAEIVQEVIEKEVIESVTSGEEYMELSLSHDGEFGFEATLTIPVEEKYVGQIANLFYFNEKTGELEFQMDTPVDTEGNIQLFFNHASDYVIVFSQSSMAEDVTNLNVTSESDVEETSKDISVTEEQKDGTNKLLVICIIIMVLAGGLATAGYFIYFNKKEISDGQDFEEWLKEEKSSKIEEETKKKNDSRKAKGIKEETENKKESQTDKYLDEDVDDYREKEVVAVSNFNTGEIRLKEEDYLDEEDEAEYLDEDVDDYKEKSK